MTNFSYFKRNLFFFIKFLEKIFAVNMSKVIVEKNQAFIDKVLHDNEQLLLKYEALKQELNETKYALQNSRVETIKSMEPRIKELIDEHKSEIEKQKNILTTRFEFEKAQIQAAAEMEKRELIQKNLDLEELSHQKLLRLKEKALNREKEIKEAFGIKIKEMAQLVEDAKKQAKREEEVARTEWQKLITEKIRNEFIEKAEMDAKYTQQKQEKMLMDIVGKLEADAHEENISLKHQLTKEEKEHRMVEQRLRQKIEELEKQINDMKESIEFDKNKYEHEMESLKIKLSSCNCDKYRSNIEELRNQNIEYLKTIEELKVSLNMCQKDKEFFMKQYEDIKEENAKNYNIYKEENEDLKLKISELETNLKMQEQKRKSEVAMIAEKVKRTIELKDQRIEQLVNQIKQLNMRDVDF